MAMPRWFGQVNKRVFNKIALRKGVRPVLIHTGRSSGHVYQTPLDAHPVDDGYLFILVYGSESDWVKNVFASGTASLRIDGQEIELTSPRLVDGETAWHQLPAGTKRPPKFLRVTEFLRMDTRD